MKDFIFKKGCVSLFDIDAFSNLIQNNHISQDHIKSKANFGYLFNYLDKLGAQTILKEENYVSRDFLDSFAGYIVGSYEKYTKYSQRLHFFKLPFNREKILNELGKSQSDKLDEIIDSYLGFITIRPIPNSIFGLTILKPPDDLIKDWLFGIREYKIHVLGREVVIKTLAYIEQDRQTSACATATIWYVLNLLSSTPRYYLKSPIDITMSTGIIAKKGGRLFPNSGLFPSEICLALKKSGLDSQKSTLDPIKVPNRKNRIKWTTSAPKIVELKEKDITKILYSYSGIKIPIIMILKIKYGNSKPEFHAVAVIGKQEPSYDYYRKPNSDIYLISDYAKTFYTIDDHFGPFANYEFTGGRELRCPWNYDFQSNTPITTDSDNLNISVKVKHIICPLYPKIRVELNNVLGVITAIDVMFRYSFKDQGVKDSERVAMNWDIQLRYSREYKEGMLDVNVPDAVRKKTLAHLYPKYIWVAKLYFGIEEIFDFIFDATALNNSCFILDINEYEFETPEFGEKLRLTLYRNKEKFKHLFYRFDKEIWINKLYSLLNVDKCYNKENDINECDICFTFDIE